MNKTAITKVVLDLNGREITLTVEEAKELFESLTEMFGPKTTFFPTYPIYIEHPYRWFWTSPNWTVTCGSSARFTMNSGNETLTYSCGTQALLNS